MRKKALSLLLALTMCLTALTPAAALGAGDAPEQPAAQEQTVSGGQEAPAPGEEEPASEEEEQPDSKEEEEPASEEPEQPASEEEQETQPTEVEPEQPAAAPVLLAAANGIAVYSTHTNHCICGAEHKPNGVDSSLTGGSIGVTPSEWTDQYTTEIAAGTGLTADDAAKFISDQDGYTISVNSAQTRLVLKKDAAPAATHAHYLCGGTNKCNEVGHDEETTQTTFAVKLTQDSSGNLLAGGVKLSTETVALNGGTATGYELEAGKNYYLGEDLNLKYSLYITGGTVPRRATGWRS